MSKVRDYNNGFSYNKVPKGHVPVVVGLEKLETERFVVKIEMLNHPSVMHLLEIAAHEFGYEQKGILRLPCDATQFRQILSSAK